MSIRPALLMFAAATTAACGAQTVSHKPIVSAPTPVIDTSIASTAFSAADYNAAIADEQFGASLIETSSDRIPYGRATYDGHVRSSAIIENEAGYDVIGDLTLGVDINSRSTFEGRNPITGTITDVTVIDRHSDDHVIPLAGTLDISGDTTSGEIDATATGHLTRDRVGSSDETAVWAIDLGGSFRDDFATADTVTGTATGGTAGGLSDDYDVTLTGNGQFYGQER